MKILNNKILTLISIVLAVFSFSGCGSEGILSSDNLVGGTPTITTYTITAYAGSNVVVHSHQTTASVWKQVYGPTVVLSSKTGTTTSFTAPSQAPASIILTYGNATYHINIIPTTTVLSLIVSGPQTVDPGALTSLHASASGGDGNYVYAWVQTAGSTVTLNKTHLSAPTFVAPQVTSDETLLFEVTVKDGQGSTVSKTETVMVHYSQLSVVVNVPANIKEGETVSLSAHITGGTKPYKIEWTAFAPIDIGKILRPNTTPTDYKANWINASPGLPASYATLIKAKVTDAAGVTVTSTEVKMTINDDPLTVTIKGNPSPIIYGANPGQGRIIQPEDINLIAKVSGGDGSYHYTWNLNTIVIPNSDHPTLTQTNTASITPGTVLNYNVEVTNTINGVIETVTTGVFITVTSPAP